MANGAIINGNELFENSNDDTGWIDVSNDASQFYSGATPNGSFLMYRILNSSLLVVGNVRNYASVNGSILKLSDAIKVPENLSLSSLDYIMQDGANYRSMLTNVNDSAATNNGYLIELIPMTYGSPDDIGNLQFHINFTIPLKNAGGAE